MILPCSRPGHPPASDHLCGVTSCVDGGAAGVMLVVCRERVEEESSSVTSVATLGQDSRTSALSPRH